MNESLSIIPRDETDLYDLLPEAEKLELDGILTYLPSILRDKSTLAACRDAAGRINLGEKQLYARVCNYINGTTGPRGLPPRSWKHLINKSRAGSVFWEATKVIGLPARFQSFYRGLCEESQRNNAGGRRELLRIWKTHYGSPSKQFPNGKRYAAIPGYDQWPRAGLCGYPVGWSERNLNNYAPDNYDSAAARTGQFLASSFRPSVRTTRTTLLFGERWQFDDHEYNLAVHYAGQMSALRPRGFGAAECLTTFVKPVFKMTLRDEEADKKLTLKEIDFQWYALMVLSTYGYRTDAAGTELRGERGLSVFRDEFAGRLHSATDKHVTCPMPGRVRGRAHEGQYENRSGKSNFKGKAIIEGFWNLIDNYFDRLPGQTGKDRLAAPEQMAGAVHALAKVLKAAPAMAADRAALLQIPFLTWAQFTQHAMRLYAEAMAATDHEIEGWDKLGFHTVDWRVNDTMPWQPQSQLMALPEAQRGAVMAVLDLPSQFPLKNPRQLSREEAFCSCHATALQRGDITRLPVSRWPHIMGLHAGRLVRINKENKFAIKGGDFGATGVEYLAQIKNGPALRDDQDYLAFVNPWQPGAMVLCKPNGAVLGLCELWKREGTNDEVGIARIMGKQGHWEAERRAGLNERHADQAAEISHMEAHNAALMSPVDAEAARVEKKLDRAAARETADFTDLGDGAPVAKPGAVTMEELSQL